MSSSTRRPEPGDAGNAAGVLLVRVALALAYPLLAHAASVRQSPLLATLALVDIALIALLEHLLRWRGGAWLLLAAILAGLAWLARTPWPLLPLLLVPVAFVALVAWAFARTLRVGQVPLIGRIVSALDGMPWPALPAEIRAYTRALTGAWALLLAALALCDLVLALLATPGGLLARVGIASPLAVATTQWSWFANFGDYGIIGGFMLLEFAWRQRRFPGRHPGFIDFIRSMARLGPGFWRGLMR